MGAYNLTHLRELEAESIYVIREVAAQFENPVLLFSGGKDSIVCFHLARKAFFPAKVPFPLMHIDTGHNFPEVLKFRDDLISSMGERLIVRKVQDIIDKGLAPDSIGGDPSRNSQQIPTLLAAIEEFKFDAAFGGARRDEEKSRAKERIFSFRAPGHRWDPKNHRPELWSVYNTRIHKGETMRVFPLSNWTELDIWQYIMSKNIEIVPLYFAAERPTFEWEGGLFMADDIDRLEKVMGKKFGDAQNPLLLSCRSGAAVSMPGMMDTVLNV